MDAIHEDDRERVEAENRRTEETGEPFVIEYRMVARDGRTVWFRDEAALQRTEAGEPAYWQGVMIDITARKEAEAGLADAEARYRALVEQLPAIAYIDPVDRKGTVYISPQTEAILGYRPDEWYADPDLWRSIVHPDDRERLETTESTDPNASTLPGDREGRHGRCGSTIRRVRSTTTTGTSPTGRGSCSTSPTSAGRRSCSARSTSSD